MLQTPVPAARPLDALTADELREWYLAYRSHQASLLASVLPREAVRPLYRRALARGGALGDDPLSLLRSMCEELLPLPPFEVWRADFLANPDEHLRDLGDVPDAPSPERPLTVAVRHLHVRGVSWSALLRGYRDAAGWWGRISFLDDAGQVFRTGRVFHEPDPAELKRRFMSFDEPALHAFLRSALP